MPMDFTKLGGILQDARKNAHYTQADVASLLGLTPQNVSSWERGKSKIDIEDFIKLCHLYGISYVELIVQCSAPQYDAEIPGLAEDEQTLITDYRRLTPPGKEYVQQSLALALRSYSEKNNAVSDLETAL